MIAQRIWILKAHKTAGIFFTDFDGTIKPESGPVCAADKAALRRLKEAGWFRVVATGRSLYNFVKAWDDDLELDALIFSSGAGLCGWSPWGPGSLVRGCVIEERLLKRAVAAAQHLGFGFFAYHAPPDNHHFYYLRPAEPPFGFEKRLEYFPDQATNWPADYFQKTRRAEISQIMMMVPASLIEETEREFCRLAPGLSTVRSSSPFGDGCLWLEIFGPGISKGQAAARLAGEMGIAPEKTVALGNDYNDIDLLAWAGQSFITADAPAEMIAGHIVMPKAGEGGLAWAARRVLAHD